MKIKYLTIAIIILAFFGCKKADKSFADKIEIENINLKEVKYYQNNTNYASYSFDINLELPKISLDSSILMLRNVIIEQIFNVNTDTATISKAINFYINEKTDAFKEPNAEFLMRKDEVNDMYSTLKCNFVYKKDNLCSYKILEDNFTGGAHPFQNVYYLNYDLELKKSLKFSDILKSESLNNTKLKELLVNQLMKQENAKTISDLNLFEVESPKDFKISEMVYFDSLNIVFAYAQYDIRPYAYGAPEIKLPINQIMDYLNDDFKKRHFIKK